MLKDHPSAVCFQLSLHMLYLVPVLESSTTTIILSARKDDPGTRMIPPQTCQRLVKENLETHAFLVNIPFLYNNLLYFISERFSQKPMRLGAFLGDREKSTKTCETHGRTVRVGRSANSMSMASGDPVCPSPTLNRR